MQELDGLPPFPERPPWTTELAAGLLRRMPNRKKPGLDGWTVSELRLLPAELHDWIASFLEEVEASGEWRRELAEPEGLLLPKPDRRPIWLLPILYRLWAVGRARLFAQWRMSWGGADAWRGAEELAWELTLELEAAEALGESVAGAALDWRKPYDHVGLHSLPAILQRAGVPRWVVAPTMAAYPAQLRIRVGRTLGEPWTPSNGMLPGRPLAVFFLSVLTWPWQRRCDKIDDSLRQRV